MTIAATFAAGAVIVVVAMALVDIGEPENPQLAESAALTAAAFGAIGLLVALRWWSGAGERPFDPNRIQLGFIIRVAIAELGLLLGVIGFVMTGSIAASVVGGTLFLGALALLAMGLKRIPET
jgi:membrane protease YdiL (CAAX protease family)